MLSDRELQLLALHCKYTIVAKGESLIHTASALFSLNVRLVSNFQQTSLARDRLMYQSERILACMTVVDVFIFSTTWQVFVLDHSFNIDCVSMTSFSHAGDSLCCMIGSFLSALFTDVVSHMAAPCAARSVAVSLLSSLVHLITEGVSSCCMVGAFFNTLFLFYLHAEQIFSARLE